MTSGRIGPTRSGNSFHHHLSNLSFRRPMLIISKAAHTHKNKKILTQHTETTTTPTTTTTTGTTTTTTERTAKSANHIIYPGGLLHVAQLWRPARRLRQMRNLAR